MYTTDVGAKVGELFPSLSARVHDVIIVIDVIIIVDNDDVIMCSCQWLPLLTSSQLSLACSM